jgi:hypothetical protein
VIGRETEVVPLVHLTEDGLIVLGRWLRRLPLRVAGHPQLMSCPPDPRVRHISPAHHR